jgi:hypothetical protein
VAAGAQTSTSDRFAIGIRGTDFIVPVQFSGQLAVTFHGDPARGCASGGLCGFSGVVVFRPGPRGSIQVHSVRHAGHTSREAYLSAENPVTSARVERVDSSGATHICTDAGTFPTPGRSGGDAAGVRVVLLQSEGNVLSTRCAGPTDGDVAAAGPQVTIPIGALQHNHGRFSLASMHSFAASGLAGTVTSTIVVQLVRPSKFPSPGPPPTPTTHKRLRIVTAQLTVVRASGRITDSLAGDPNQGVCVLLDACGLAGTLTMSMQPERATGGVEVVGSAKRPMRDFLAALGFRSGGRGRGLQVGGSINWGHGGRLVAALNPSPQCSDSRPLGGGAIDIEPRPGSLTAALTVEDDLRTRCPGPLAGLRATAFAQLPRGVLRRRVFSFSLRAQPAWRDDGYRVRQAGSLVITVLRGRITQQVVRAPA